MNDTEGSEWESKIPASAVYVDQDGDRRRLSDVLAGIGGDVTVSWADVEGKPTTFPPTIGTTAETAKPGDYTPTWGDVTGKPATFAPATHTHTIAQVDGLQAVIDDFETRIAALEPEA